MWGRGLCIGGSRGRWLSRKGRRVISIRGITVDFDNRDRLAILIGHRLRLGDGRRNLRKSGILRRSTPHDIFVTSQDARCHAQSQYLLESAHSNRSAIIYNPYIMYQLSTIYELPTTRNWLPKRSHTRKRHFRSNRPPRTDPYIYFLQQFGEFGSIIKWI